MGKTGLKKYTTLEDQDDIDRVREMKLTLEELELVDIRRDYKALRNAYFKDSKLPPVEHVAILFVDGKVICGVEGEGESNDYLGYCVDHLAPYTAMILILRGCGRHQTRMTLLHEMAHIAVEIRYKRPMGHGPVWQREMLRLAKIGAFANWW